MIILSKRFCCVLLSIGDDVYIVNGCGNLYECGGMMVKMGS